MLGCRMWFPELGPPHLTEAAGILIVISQSWIHQADPKTAFFYKSSCESPGFHIRHHFFQLLASHWWFVKVYERLSEVSPKISCSSLKSSLSVTFIRTSDSLALVFFSGAFYLFPESQNNIN